MKDSEVRRCELLDSLSDSLSESRARADVIIEDIRKSGYSNACEGWNLNEGLRRELSLTERDHEQLRSSLEDDLQDASASIVK